MGTGRTLNKTSRTRPSKSARARRRREKVQQKRLVALGVEESSLKKMTSKDVRTMLKRPVKLKKQLADKAAGKKPVKKVAKKKAAKA